VFVFSSCNLCSSLIENILPIFGVENATSVHSVVLWYVIVRKEEI
jgi:hypothetical protein